MKTPGARVNIRVQRTIDTQAGTIPGGHPANVRIVKPRPPPEPDSQTAIAAALERAVEKRVRRAAKRQP